jgi:hypothetical protein
MFGRIPCDIENETGGLLDKDRLKSFQQFQSG